MHDHWYSATALQAMQVQTLKALSTSCDWLNFRTGEEWYFSRNIFNVSEDKSADVSLMTAEIRHFTADFPFRVSHVFLHEPLLISGKAQINQGI